MCHFFGRVDSTFEELNMLNMGHWKGLTCCRFGCRLGCHLVYGFGIRLGSTFGRGLGSGFGRLSLVAVCLRSIPHAVQYFFLLTKLQ